MLVVLYHIQGQQAFAYNYIQTLVNSHDLKHGFLHRLVCTRVLPIFFLTTALQFENNVIFLRRLHVSTVT